MPFCDSPSPWAARVAGTGRAISSGEASGRIRGCVACAAHEPGENNEAIRCPEECVGGPARDQRHPDSVRRWRERRARLGDLNPVDLEHEVKTVVDPGDPVTGTNGTEAREVTRVVCEQDADPVAARPDRGGIMTHSYVEHRVAKALQNWSFEPDRRNREDSRQLQYRIVGACRSRVAGRLDGACDGPRSGPIRQPVTMTSLS